MCRSTVYCDHCKAKQVHQFSLNILKTYCCAAGMNTITTCVIGFTHMCLHAYTEPSFLFHIYAFCSSHNYCWLHVTHTLSVTSCVLSLLTAWYPSILNMSCATGECEGSWVPGAWRGGEGLQVCHRDTQHWTHRYCCTGERAGDDMTIVCPSLWVITICWYCVLRC